MAIATLGAGFATAPENVRVEALKKIEQTPFFQTMRVKTLGVLYATEMAYRYFGYEGEAFSKGGYLFRGFNDLRWLPEVPLRPIAARCPGKASEAHSWRSSISMTTASSSSSAPARAAARSRTSSRAAASRWCCSKRAQRQSLATFSQVPGEAFVQLTWLDPRTQSGTWTRRAGLSDAAVLDVQDGGRHHGSLDRRHAAHAARGS